MQINKKVLPYLLLGLIMLNGLLLRVGGLNWGIPRAPYWKAYHPDESVAFTTLLKMSTAEEGFNPHYFVNPTLHYYLIGVLWWAAHTVKFVPSPREIMDEASTVTLDHVARIWLTARSLSVAFGVLTIWLTYLLGREFFKNDILALAGAWLAAVMPTMVIQSHYLTVDGPVGFWFLAALWLIIKAFKDKRPWMWAAAGLVSGLAAATKYNALVGLASVFSVLLIRQKIIRQERIEKAAVKISLFAGCLIAGFLLGCPHSVLSFGEWKDGISSLLAYNDFATDWTYPWLVTSRFSLGWPAWVLFLASLPMLFIKPDKTGLILAAGILPYLLIYGYKASPFMRHMVLIVPLMILLILYAADKAGRYLRRRSFSLIASILILLASGYALANSLAWVKVMSGQDPREEAAEYIKHGVQPGSVIGLAGRLWFYTPPLEESQYRLLRLDYDPAKLEYFQPPLIIVSEYESKQYAFCRVTPEVRDEFFSDLKINYRASRVFKRIPRCWGISFEGYPLADWNYFYPEITIYERCLK
jgi:4-amino-4-deoxy-L-arabinose transferase-like glycosyltransferase